MANGLPDAGEASGGSGSQAQLKSHLLEKAGHVAIVRAGRAQFAIFSALTMLSCAGLLFCVVASHAGRTEIVFGCITLFVICTASLWLQRWWAAGWCIATVIVCLAANEAMTPTSDGLVTIQARLAILDAENLHDSPVVLWVLPGADGWSETPWNAVPGGEFIAPAEVMVYNASGYFHATHAWRLYGQPIIVIRIGDKMEFAFMGDELFASPRSGEPPMEIKGTVNVGDYLSGKNHCQSLRSLQR